MRILLISGSFPPLKCGVGDYTKQLAIALAESKDISVGILTSVGADYCNSDVRIEVFPVIDAWSSKGIPKILHIVKQWRPDLVHIQYPTKGYAQERLPSLLPILLWIYGVTVVRTWHEYSKDLTGKTFILNWAVPGGCIVTRPLKEEALPYWKRLFVKHRKIQLIPIGSNIPTAKISSETRKTIFSKYASKNKFMLVYFGFVSETKDLELLFEIADQAKHHLVLICELNPKDAYQNRIITLTNQPKWRDSVTVTGYLPAEEVSYILAAADAVVLPFKFGTHYSNGTLCAAINQGTFVLTTSLQQNGYDASKNIYYAKPGDIKDMRNALGLYIGRRKLINVDNGMSEWADIANRHINLYRQLKGNDK
jgi:glycosyltransferase involved in cell wall biosynthesis